VVFKKDQGQLESEILYREHEDSLELVQKSLPYSFDADPKKLKLVSEAYRIHLAHLFDPYLAVHISDIDPLPHQITAVYQEMLSRQPLRFLLADDPGAGKTIMTGLFIKELILRGDLKRCLIVSPGSLVDQWQDELYRKFNIKFDILTNDRLEGAVTGNAFLETSLCIARLDKLARNEELQEKLKLTDWDLVVCDEAHKMSAHYWADEIKYTKRFNLGRLLSNLTRHFLLLTATPHNGKEADFRLFLSLIDSDRFEGTARTSHQSLETGDIMRRLVKEELLKFDGTPLFPERRAETVTYTLADNEARLYSEVTAYVREEFNRADQLNNERKNTVGFALTTLQRRLASSPEAIYQSLKRRKERLKNRLDEERLAQRGLAGRINWSGTAVLREDDDDDDYSSEEFEEREEKVTDQATAATTISELEAEIEVLKRLESLAVQVRHSDEDRKWRELSSLLRDSRLMSRPDGSREKLIIFTEHRDTLTYLTNKIRSLLANEKAVVNIHGGLGREERRKAEELFKQDKDACILVATDAAGEGINLQRAHLMVNYDIPWNPNRLEQRFGRIHRIGQLEVCHLWNMVADGTREGMVFEILFRKLEIEKEALGGKVFDILGKLTFNNKPLKDLLIEAIRYGTDLEVRERMTKTVDQALNSEHINELLAANALTEDFINFQMVTAIRENMERLEARKMQPHFIEAFFLEAFQGLGGKIHPREPGRWEISFVPQEVRNRDINIGTKAPVLKSYERVCFDKSGCQKPGQVPAALICPGHQLLEAVLDLVREKNQEVLKRGAVMVDDNDPGQEPRLLFYIENSIQDGILTPKGTRRVVSQQVRFVEIMEDGSARNAGYAPYLDYRGPRNEELDLVKDYIKDKAWLQENPAEAANSYAVENIIPQHLTEIKNKLVSQADKTIKAVRERLTAEIWYWDRRAEELKSEENRGRKNSELNSALAYRRAEELVDRKNKRLAELDKEKMISALPPVLIGSALIIPRGLLDKLAGTAGQDDFGGEDRKAVELAAMNRVLEIEKSLGFTPKDVHDGNLGYDIESHVPPELAAGGSTLRFIEVKGRKAGAGTVTVSYNEILTGLNKREDYILALVEVDGDLRKTWYIRQPFTNLPDFTAASVNLDTGRLKRLPSQTFF
jgi:SNF2 family DNA or RNA helicase